MRIFKAHKYELVSILAASLFLMTLIKLFLSFYIVKGESMTPTIFEKNWIVSHKFEYGLRLKNHKKYLLLWKNPKKNEMVLIKDPITNKIAIKKIFAIPGEKFKQIEKNKICIHDLSFKIDENVLKKNTKKIPDNHYLVIGENKQTSLDSRDYGFVKIDNILGKIIYYF
ncbi:signal peptidase I [Borreliella valaisiana]|uniref:Signal peptidase I n=1 Tax=Borreliella valaisiana VS116 TaxID=445987 RepID=D6RXA5_BORVA|nr:signal peptidase I [Borreliella valaisiana]AIJ29632.1 signal peptidase [Borreliella valaisiana Tom4006]EEF81909.1 signal peptidase I [Borreliella valaisiana VS116]WKC76913.1 signal peptidase I [Borreliella valaisiana]WLN25074.1 signal peptidase I [Borreliella valaisiana]WVN14000.1 signal peptidase I [Borreliella valaisiana]